MEYLLHPAGGRQPVHVHVLAGVHGLVAGLLHRHCKPLLLLLLPGRAAAQPRDAVVEGAGVVEVLAGQEARAARTTYWGVDKRVGEGGSLGRITLNMPIQFPK